MNIGFTQVRRAVGPFAFILGLAAALTFLVSLTPFYSQLERWLLDRMNAVTAPVLETGDTLIVDIDDASMNLLESQLGAWPYDRRVYAEVTAFLSRAGAKGIVYDILFPESREGDEDFARAISDAGMVVLASRELGSEFHDVVREDSYFRQLDGLSWPAGGAESFSNDKEFLIPHDGLADSEGQGAAIGVISLDVDDDGVLREVPLIHRANGRYLPAMWLAALFAGAEPPRVTYVPERGELRAGPHAWPVDERGRAILRFPRNALDATPAVPFHEILLAAAGHAEYQHLAKMARDRVVFIGSSATKLGDFAFVPTHDRMAGLRVLALNYENLAKNLLLKRAAWPWTLLLMLLAAVIPLLVAGFRNLPETVVSTVGVFGLLAAATVHLMLLGFAREQASLLFPLMLGVFAFLVRILVSMKNLYDERRRLFYEKMAADEANALKSQFLSHMTHELRTPLTAIMGYNRLLSDEATSPEERSDHVGIIDKNCSHLLSLINNLLDQAKIEAGQMSLNIASVSVDELIKGVMDTLRPLADKKGLYVRSEFADGVPPALRVDELRLRQIVFNLTGNAIKFTDSGGVTLGVNWSQGRFQLDVSDTGPGMSEEALKRIFQAFQQADVTVATTHGGTGLGLSISRNLATLMDGNIKVSSKLGKGTTFTLSIAADAGQLDAEAEPAEQVQRNAAPAVRGRVLVADDTDDIRNLMSVYLKKMGVEVLLAENGKEALDIALEQKPDMIFMDMQMPIMDGLEAVRALRETNYQGTVLALTAQTDGDQIQAALDAGCDGYAEKPISRDRLQKIIRKRLGRRSELTPKPAAAAPAKQPRSDVEHSSGASGRSDGQVETKAKDEVTPKAEPAAVEGKVLVADDTDDIRNLLSVYLKKMGVGILLAENGQEAVDIAFESQPDLVLMDMQMPVMDGLEAVRTLRGRGYAGTVLALTGQTDGDQIQATLDAGCDGHVEKPISRDRLQQIVRERLAPTQDAHAARRTA